MRSTIRRILKEDVNNTLYDKIIKVMRRPYVDFLRKNGLGDKETVKEIMKRKLGDGDIIYFSSVLRGSREYTFNWSTKDRGYYEETKYKNQDKIFWVHTEKVHEMRRSGYDNSLEEILTLKKTISDEGKKGYFELTDDRSEIKHSYYTYPVYDDDIPEGTSWDDAPIEIKNDKFFSTNY